MPAALEPDMADRGPARVLLVDDHPQFLALINDVVCATDRMEVVGEADCGERAVEAVEQLHPDIVLMDVRMPGLGGIEAARRIKVSQPATMVLLVSTTHPDELPTEARAGVADAFIWKSQLRPGVLDQLWLRYVRAL